MRGSARSGLASIAVLATFAAAPSCSSDADPAAPEATPDGGRARDDAAAAPDARSGGDGGADAGRDADGGEPSPLCKPFLPLGALAPAGASPSPTGTYSDWFWPGDVPLTSFDWKLSIDFEPPNDGYFWAHQFGYVNGAAGYVGLQAHGYFEPVAGGVQIVKMALFSIGGGVVAAEAGDPDPTRSRVHGTFDGEQGASIHLKYDWVPCRTYALRVERETQDGTGKTWWRAYVRDTVTGVDTLIGRHLLPATWGGLAAQSVMWSERFGYTTVTECSIQEHSSVVFGRPTANGGKIQISSTGDHFYDPTNCPNSRITRSSDGAYVRQEMGVPP